MFRRTILSAVLLALAVGPVAAGVDLKKIDRGIAKEPAYQTKSLKYCILVFGPEALTRVWVVRDGDTLYVDKNGNGDLTESAEKLMLPASESDRERAQALSGLDITAKAGVAPNTKIDFRLFDESFLIYCQAEGRPWQRAGGDATGALQFGDKPATAPIIHFQGPLSIAPDEEYTLNRGGEEPTEFYVFLGTPGLGKGTFACIGYSEVPKDVHPVANIEFPAKSMRDPPIKASVTLSKRC
jgi:hypothetical protein